MNSSDQNRVEESPFRVSGGVKRPFIGIPTTLVRDRGFAREASTLLWALGTLARVLGLGRSGDTSKSLKYPKP